MVAQIPVESKLPEAKSLLRGVWEQVILVRTGGLRRRLQVWVLRGKRVRWVFFCFFVL